MRSRSALFRAVGCVAFVLAAAGCAKRGKSSSGCETTLRRFVSAVNAGDMRAATACIHTEWASFIKTSPRFLAEHKGAKLKGATVEVTREKSINGDKLLYFDASYPDGRRKYFKMHFGQQGGEWKIMSLKPDLAEGTDVWRP